MHSVFLPSKPRAIGKAVATAAISIAVGPARVQLLPFESWPDWAKDLAHDRQPTDTGLGDTIVHLIGDTRSEKFKTWFHEKFGKSCGCTERQRWLNQRFPYAVTGKLIARTIDATIPGTDLLAL